MIETEADSSEITAGGDRVNAIQPLSSPVAAERDNDPSGHSSPQQTPNANRSSPTPTVITSVASTANANAAEDTSGDPSEPSSESSRITEPALDLDEREIDKTKWPDWLSTAFGELCKLASTEIWRTFVRKWLLVENALGYPNGVRTIVIVL